MEPIMRRRRAYRPLQHQRLRLAAIHLLILAIGALAATTLETVTVRSQQISQLDRYRDGVSDIVERAEARLNAYETLTENLVAFMGVGPNDSSEKFNSLAGILSENNPSIVNVAMSDPYVITQVYPIEPNRAALGLDFNTRPDLKRWVDAALESGEVVVQGPVNLVQGGTGLIIRAANPEIGPEVFSIVIDMKAFLAEAGFFDNSINDEISIRAFNTDTAEVLLGNQQVWAANPVVGSIRLNETTVLQIGAAPKAGWISVSSHRGAILAVVFCLLVISYAGVHYARRLIIDRADARRQLVAAIESLEDGFVVYDEYDCLLLCNEKYKQYYAKSADLFVPGNTFEYIIREGVARGQYLDAIGREEEWIAERLALHANPKEPTEQRLPDGRWLKISESKTRDGFTVGFRVDISELKSALLAAEEASAAKTDFLNNMSHELRTPLSIILGYIAFLKNVTLLPSYAKVRMALGDDADALTKLDDFANDIMRQADKSDNSGKHLLGLIDSVLDWSKLSNNRIELDQSAFDLDAILQNLTSEMQEKASAKGIEVTYSGVPCVVTADEMRMRQVFINLVSNAVKFTETGFVRITLSQIKAGVEVSVEDSGPGIPEDHLGSIFERFEQVDASISRKFGGTGLGLAICKSLVDLHGGSIRAESTLGNGSKFTVYIPGDAFAPSAIAA